MEAGKSDSTKFIIGIKRKIVPNLKGNYLDKKIYLSA